MTTLAAIIAHSGYDRPALSVEVVRKNSGIEDEHTFLQHTLTAATHFGQLITAARSAP